MSSPFTLSEADQVISPPSQLEILWTNHRGAVVGTVIALIAASLAVIGIAASDHASRIASETLLSEATDASGWAKVIAKYPRSAAGADAMLLMAASLRDAGKLEESDALYSRFAESFPQSPIAVSGMIGRASNSRVGGHLDRILNDYQQAVAAYPQSYGAPFALYETARLLARDGKTEEVKRLLQSLATTYPGSVAAAAAGISAQPARSTSPN